MKRKKLGGSAILSIRRDDNQLGGSATGIAGEFKQLTKEDGSPVLSNTYGNHLYTLDLINPTSGEIKTYWADGGLRGALKMARVNPGMHIEIVHTGEKKIDQGTVQTYDIFELENE